MFRPLSPLLLALVAFFAGAAARADDVLFLGLNAAYHEMMAAKKAAEKTGRHLVVFPDLPEAEWKRYFDLKAAEAALLRPFQKDCMSNPEPTSSCQLRQVKMVAQLDKLKAARDLITTKATFNEKAFTDFLARRQQEHKSFSSVVVSGHDGTGTLSGDFGMIRGDALANLLAKAGLRDSVRAIHLWGCYTASPSSVVLDWKQNFPNIQFIAGYDGRAPLSDKPAGWQYLEGVIEREDKLIQTTDAKKLQAALKAIPGAIQLNAGIANCDSYANMKEAFEISEIKSQCERYEKELKAAMPKYECYLHGDAGCEDVPADTGQGTLRDFYGITQKADVCRKVAPSSTFEAHDRDEALRLLFYRGVAGNFGRSVAPVLPEIDEALELVGAPKDLRFAKIGELPRVDAIKQFDRLGRFVDEHFRDYDVDPKNRAMDAKLANLFMLQKFFRAGAESLAKLSSACVPYSWHEANSPEPLMCLEKSDLGRASVAAALSEPDGVLRFAEMATAQNLKKEIEAGTIGTSEGDGLYYRARLKAFSPYASENERKLGEEALPWTEIVRKLEKEGVKNPTEDPRALSALYEANGLRVRRELAVFQESFAGVQKLAEQNPEAQKVYDYYKNNIAYEKASVDALLLKQALLRNDLGDEERKLTQRTLEEKEAAIGELLAPLKKKEKSDLLAAYELYSRDVRRATLRYPESNELKKSLANYEVKMGALRRDLAEADSDPGSFGLRQAREHLYTPPIKLGPIDENGQ